RSVIAGLGLASLALPALAGEATGTQHSAVKPDRVRTDADKNGSTLPTVPPLAVRALHRMGFGPARRRKKPARQALEGRLFGDDFETLGDLGEDDIGYFMSLGQDDDTRLANYVEQQLHPASI